MAHISLVGKRIVKWFKNILNFIKRKHVSSELNAMSRSTANDWIIAVDVLVPLIQTARSDFDPAKLHRYDLGMFETTSYLYQVDRLVVKIREYVLAFRYYETQFSRQPEMLDRVEFINATQSCLDCYHTIISLVLLFQKLPRNKLLSNEFVLAVQTLEFECSSLRSSIRALNQFMSPIPEPVSLPAPHSADKLRERLKLITQPEDHKLLISFINAYDVLVKCYVIARKAVIKDTLDGYYYNVDELMSDFSTTEVNKDDIFNSLMAIFNHIESLRFSTHRESRCSRNLYEKAKFVRHRLRIACLNHPLAKEFVQDISLSRVKLLKDNKASR